MRFQSDLNLYATKAGEVSVKLRVKPAESMSWKGVAKVQPTRRKER
jgi:hypothetical protein